MITVKQVGPSDVDLYRAIRLQAMEEDPEWFEVGSECEAQLSDEEWADRVSQLESDRTAVFLALAEGVPCGLAEVFVSDDDPHRPRLAPLWVASGHGRRAINEALTGAAFAWANMRGDRVVRVSFRPGVHLYMKVHCSVRERRRSE